MIDRKAFIHPLALVEEGATIGSGTRIWAFVHVLPDVIIGDDCNVCDHCFIESGVRVGDRVTVKSGIYIWQGVSVDDDVFLGPNVVFTNDTFPRSKIHPGAYEKTHVGRGASVGANATLLPGITIGAYALIGAGSVVTKSVPDFHLVYGNPARSYGRVCACTAELKFTERFASCSCGRHYQLAEDGRIELVT